MTIRRMCSIKPEHQVVLAAFTEAAYPPPGHAFDAAGAQAMLEQPAFGEVLRNLSGALNVGKLYDDAGPAEPSTVLTPAYGAGDQGDVAGRNLTLSPGQGASIVVQGPARLSVRVPDGVHVFVSYSATPGVYEEGSASHGSGTAEVPLPSGQWYANAKLGPEMTGTFPANILLGVA